MIAMDLIHADNLTPDQLMLGDLIKVGDDIVEILFIESDSTGDNYDVQTENEFGEKEVTQYSYTDLIPLYVFIDDDDYYPPERISHAVEVLKANPKALCAGSSAMYIHFKHINKMVQFGAPFGRVCG